MSSRYKTFFSLFLLLFSCIPRDDISSLRMNKQHHETGREQQPARPQARSSFDSWIDLFLHSYFIRDDSLQSDEDWWNVVKVQKRTTQNCPLSPSRSSLRVHFGRSDCLCLCLHILTTWEHICDPSLDDDRSARENAHQKRSRRHLSYQQTDNNRKEITAASVAALSYHVDCRSIRNSNIWNLRRRASEQNRSEKFFRVNTQTKLS